MPAVPAEVQQGAGGGGNATGRPAEQVELGQRSGLLGLHVLQVETTHQEVLTPDVLRHQVHLRDEVKVRWLGGTGTVGLVRTWTGSDGW